MASPVTSLAASATVPAKSNPAPRGNDRPLTSFSFPARTAVSAALTLVAATRTSTRPGFTRGTGTVRICPDQQPGPEARYEASEAISLAFITALQLLPPRQRAALILCDVLGFRAGEAAAMLGSTYGAIGKLTAAYTAADLDSLVALLTDDVRLSMPPHPFEYHGRAVAAQGLGQLFAHGHRYKLLETRANGQPALAVYRSDPHAAILHASGLLVITLAGPGSAP